ncbi:MAG: stimulus-sensing domain-containing protein [Kiloniellales bacterium]|nr:stimulus-sensing domain-containing protein [Kiloniellales bacterium]MDJ0982187.1 stimulus-sensing domain-containing protein [Kiloniellales bacterium]
MTAESEIKPLLVPRAEAENVSESAEQPQARRGGRLPILGSPLTRRILTLNVLVLLIPVLGLLHLEQFRDSLVEAELEALNVQGRAFSLSLAGGAVVVSPSGEESILPEATRNVMRILLPGSGVRARLFDRGGNLVADSFRLTGKGGQVHVVELAPLDGGTAVSRTLSRMLDRAIDWLPGVDHLPVYYEAPVQRATDYDEVANVLRVGRGGGMARVGRRGGLVLSAAVPVQRYRQVLGALMLSKDGSDIEAAVRHRRRDILLVFAIALGVTILLSIYLANTIARPVQRLAEAADRVRHAKGRQVEIPDMSHRRDEVGELSAALIDMTESLWTRLDAIERFAADVAHEIKNPLTSVRSAVETVARVDDPEQQKKLMSIILDDVQRLDRLISDISDASRLDAELSRAQTESVDLAQLLGALSETYDAVIEEKELKFELSLPTRDIVVQGIEGRLGQVFRNLISNAISFSPPGGTIRLQVRPQSGVVEILVDDDGPGIPETKLAAIFDRFYSERPSDEKFGTHSGLGLSISKQIVEALGGQIAAENRRNSDGTVVGARFRVRLPLD